MALSRLIRVRSLFAFFAILVTADKFAARSLATPVAAILGRKEGGKAF